MRGSTIKRGNTWTAYWFTTDPATGKRRQHSKGGFRTQKLAQAHLNSILERVESGAWKPDQKLTVEQLLTNHWLPSVRTEGHRPATVEQYESVVEHWIVPHIGAKVVSTLTPSDVQKYVEKIRTAKTATGRKGLSARSAQLSVGILKAATAWALTSGLLGRDPLAGVKRPKVTRKPVSAWSTDEARRFLAATKDSRHAWAWALLLSRGLRRGELCGLKWHAVDLDGGVVRIVRTRILIDGKVADSIPKTLSGLRSVPIDSYLVALLKAHKARQAAEQLAAGEAYQDDGWLFADELGRPYYPSSLSVWFEEARVEAKLPKIPLHGTRHTAASLMLADRVPVRVVSEMLGHSDPNITLSVYAHVIPGMAEQAGASLSASLLGTTEMSVDKALTSGDSGESAGGVVVPLSRTFVAGGAGLEPATSGSKVRCSAN